MSLSSKSFNNNCRGKMKHISKQEVLGTAKDILQYQKKREELLAKKVTNSSSTLSSKKSTRKSNEHKGSKFSYGMRSKTKYGQKAINSAFKSAIGWVNYLSNNRFERAANATVNLATVLGTSAYNSATIDNLMSVVDLGYRIPNSRTATAVLNLVMFGTVMVNDYQAYLLTPVGLQMLYNLVNGDARAQEEFIEMLIDAHINGVDASDILSDVPQLIPICDISTPSGMIVNWVSRRLVYESIIRGDAPRMIVRAIRRGH